MAELFVIFEVLVTYQNVPSGWMRLAVVLSGQFDGRKAANLANDFKKSVDLLIFHG